MSNTLKYIHNSQRNRLLAQDLTCYARGFESSAFNVESYHIHGPFWRGSALRSCGM
jgi:hypothetical protein